MPRSSKPHLHKGTYRTRIDGQTHYLGSNKRQAFAKFHRLMAQCGDVPRSDRPATINGAIEAWLLLHPSIDYEKRLVDFAVFAGGDLLADVTADLLERYHLHLRDVRGLAPKTVIDRVRVATRVLRHAAHPSRRWVPLVPDVPRMDKPTKTAKDIPPARLRDLFAKIPTTGRTARPSRILRFILATGARPSEACRLQWEDVRLDKATATLPEHKTASKGQTRTLYLTTEAMKILTTMPPHATTGPVFLNTWGWPYTVAALGLFLKRRGIAGGYALRHTFAQINSERMPVQDLAALMGHTDVATTGHYYHVRDERSREVASKIPPMLDEPTEEATVIPMPA